jgi:hypothetical protein
VSSVVSVVPASAVPTAGLPVPTASAVAPAAPSASLPADPSRAIKVVTYGMHVGGGPFDEATKVPFKRAVEPHFPRLAQCMNTLPKPVVVDAGVDLLIEAAGGHGQVARPRGSEKSEAFLSCVVKFFESIEFEKNKSGKIGVSYSVRMSPGAAR